ncbi:MAG: formate dehydrogenase accessory sulfurtransferase FdhD [Deltaproteobacteria bacterium]|nr:MAG: formate dehydrogenase accessory sulfurtransferase FdhD [Deltaproteobacteria bacterium]TMB36960.1 MAG: formate dehydrogenase accessory sulfurtransferase FdhD [Deltaproteobacteria bacterium]
MKGVAQREVRRVAEGVLQAPAADDVVAEEPLEIRAQGETLAITMRTPGADRELAVGFLFAEGVIGSRDEVGRVAHCGRPDQEGYGNTIDVVPGPGVSLDIERISATRRGTLTTAACGVCGRRTVDDVIARCAPLPVGRATIAAASILAAVESLRARQPNFARTGGIHGAALHDAQGNVLAAFEDIGRHNAVDKVVGALLLAGRIPGAEAALLVVSGRASYEVVQKASAARVPVIASVSAASSLAVDLARATGITLCGFVRKGTMTVYAHADRIVVPATG